MKEKKYLKRDEPIKLKRNESREEFMKRCVKQEEKIVSHKEACDYCATRFNLLHRDYDNELIDRFIYNSF